jgi:thiol:disulfide interchange protein DsbC
MNTKLPTIFVFSVICAFSMSACAQHSGPADGDPASRPDAAHAKQKPFENTPIDKGLDAKIRELLMKVDPNFVPDYIGPAAVPGYQEVIRNGDVVFVTDDGNYLVQGLMDLRDKREIAQSGALPGRRKQAISEIPVSERIVFAPIGSRKHTVSVFTDIECGYCRKLHQDIGQYNKLGIAIEYLAFPRAGIGSPDAIKMESVWCSDDRQKALTDAKNGVIVPPRKCESPVKKHYEIGKRVGLKGTPMIVTSDGIALPGYMPPERLLNALDELASQRKNESAD